VWNKIKFADIFKAKNQLSERMKQLQQLMINNGNPLELIKEETYLGAQISIREKKEEILWCQKYIV
jgi:hypothetical protein